MRDAAATNANLRRYACVRAVILLFAPYGKDIHRRRIGDKSIAEGVAREHIGGLFGDGAGYFPGTRGRECVPASPSIAVRARHVAMCDISGSPEESRRFSGADECGHGTKIQIGHHTAASGPSGATRAACSPGSLHLAFNSRLVRTGE